MSISDAWTAAAEQIRRDGKLFLSVALLLIGLPSAVFQLFVPQEMMMAALKAREFPPSFLLAVPTWLLSLYGSLALTALAVIPRVSVGEALGVAARRFAAVFLARLMLGFSFAVVALLALIAVGANRPLGALLLFAASAGILYAYVRFMLVEPATIAETLGPVGALRRSWQLTAGSFWRLLGFLAVFGIGSLILSFVAGLIGGLFAILFEKGLSFPAAGAVLAILFPALANAVISTVYAPTVANIYRRVIPADVAQSGS